MKVPREAYIETICYIVGGVLLVGGFYLAYLLLALLSSMFGGGR